MKKLLSMLLAGILAISLLAGCGSTTPQNSGETANAATAQENAEANAQETTEESLAETPPETQASTRSDVFLGDRLVVATANSVTGFNPFGKMGNLGVELNWAEKLAQVDAWTGVLRLVLLKSIEQKDELTYECELWDFITDTAGNNITANDVKWNVDKLMSEGTEISKLKELKVTGDYTFEWIISEPYTVGEYEKQITNFSIVSQKAYESDPDLMSSNPVGTGPYKLKDFMEGSFSLWEANEDYWYNNITDEEWLAENDCVATYQNFKEIRIDVITDSTARAIALENGELDAVTSINTADAAIYNANPDLGIKVVDVPVKPPVAFLFNCSENSPCSDINLRKAICYAIDNAGIAAGYDNPAVPAYGIQPRMFDAPKSWLTGEGVDYYNYNLDKAREYLEKSSYNGEKLVLEFSAKNEFFKSAFILLQAQLREIGVDLEIKMVDAAAETPNDVFTGWDLKGPNMGGGNYVLNTVQRMFWSGSNMAAGDGRNVNGIADPELERLFNDMFENYNEDTILAWHDYFTDQAYGYAICCYNNLCAVKSIYNEALWANAYNLCPGAFTLAE